MLKSINAQCIIRRLGRAIEALKLASLKSAIEVAESKRSSDVLCYDIAGEA
jgi:hypothetical protein